MICDALVVEQVVRDAARGDVVERLPRLVPARRRAAPRVPPPHQLRQLELVDVVSDDVLMVLLADREGGSVTQHDEVVAMDDGAAVRVA